VSNSVTSGFPSGCLPLVHYMATSTPCTFGLLVFGPSDSDLRRSTGAPEGTLKLVIFYLAVHTVIEVCTSPSGLTEHLSDALEVLLVSLLC